MDMNLETIKQKVVEAYHKVIEQNLIRFALMDEDDAHYITIRYSGRIMALQYLADQGHQWAAEDYHKLMAIMESPIRHFLVALELQMNQEGVNYQKLF